jgi:hypothetical protein
MSLSTFFQGHNQQLTKLRIAALGDMFARKRSSLSPRPFGKPTKRITRGSFHNEQIKAASSGSANRISNRGVSANTLLIQNIPRLPPCFSTRRIFWIFMVFSAALAMSYTVSAATETAVRASISTPVLPTVLAEALNLHTRQGFVEAQFHVHFGQGNRVAERNQLRGAFGGLDSGDFGNGQHIALFHLPVADEGQRFGLHHNFAARNRDALGIVLVADIDHVGAALVVEVGELGHGRNYTVGATQ